VANKKENKSKAKELELDSDLALTRAANFLEEIGMIAWQKRDTETLLNVTEGWLKIAEILDNEASEQRIDKRIIGFVPEKNSKE
jgi:hypothetical protein